MRVVTPRTIVYSLALVVRLFAEVFRLIVTLHAHLQQGHLQKPRVAASMHIVARDALSIRNGVVADAPAEITIMAVTALVEEILAWLHALRRVVAATTFPTDVRWMERAVPGLRSNECGRRGRRCGFGRFTCLRRHRLVFRNIEKPVLQPITSGVGAPHECDHKQYGDTDKSSHGYSPGDSFGTPTPRSSALKDNALFRKINGEPA